MQVLYAFSGVGGGMVLDVSGFEEALDLLIPVAGKVSWGEGMLSTAESMCIDTAGAVSRLRTTLQSSIDLMMEA